MCPLKWKYHIFLWKKFIKVNSYRTTRIFIGSVIYIWWYLQLDPYFFYICWYLQLDPYFFTFADMCTPVELMDLGCIVPSVCQKVLKVTPSRRITVKSFLLISKSKTLTQQFTYIFWYCIYPRRMILFQIWFSSISLFLLVSFSIPSHVLAVHLAVEHWKDGIITWNM